MEIQASNKSAARQLASCCGLILITPIIAIFDGILVMLYFNYLLLAAVRIDFFQAMAVSIIVGLLVLSYSRRIPPDEAWDAATYNLKAQIVALFMFLAIWGAKALWY